MTRNVLVISLALLGTAALPAAAGSRLQSRISADRSALRTSDEVVVRFSLKNAGDESARVLRWLTPLHGVDDDLFEVTRDGEAVTYLGRVYKRAMPQASDYVEVAAGGTVESAIVLSTVYDMGKPGTYTVRFRVELFDPLSDRPQGRVASNSLTLTLEGEDLSQPIADDQEGVEGPGSRYLTPTYTSCSSTRQTSLKSALSSAQTYAANSLSYLNAGTVGSRYTTWFGTYSSTRYSTVRSHYTKIDSTIKTKTISFNCGCTDSAYAYVYPSQPYKVYLCNAFWSAPNTGTDSRAGTLIHELSHFNVVAGTDDWAYGQTAAKNLARSNPGKAVDNADNHEYFSENTPSLN